MVEHGLVEILLSHSKFLSVNLKHLNPHTSIGLSSYGVNNHKSSLNRYGQGLRNINGQHLYDNFLGEGHSGLSDFRVQIIDSTDVIVINPTERESYWIEKINCYCPLGLNMREESNY